MKHFLALSLNSPSVNNVSRRHGRRSRTRAINTGRFGREQGRNIGGAGRSQHEMAEVVLLFAIIIMQAESAAIVLQTHSSIGRVAAVKTVSS